MASTVDFRISASPSTDHGYDATNGEVLELQIEASPALDINKVVFTISQDTKNAPATVFSPVSGQAATPTGIVTLTMPASGAHSYMIRCVGNSGADLSGKQIPEWTRERIVVIRSAASLRKILPAEIVEYDPIRGWTSAQNDDVDAFSGIVVSATASPWKIAARLVATTNLSLTGAATIDATVGINTDRILAAGQTDPKENGLYTLNTGGPWTRTADANENTEWVGDLIVEIQAGATKADSLWKCTTDGTIILGTSNLVFAQVVGGATSVTAPITNAGSPSSPVIGISAASGATAGSQSIAHFNLLANATHLATPSTLALRHTDASCDFGNSAIVGSGTAKYGLLASLALISGTDTSFTQGASNEIRVTGAAVNNGEWYGSKNAAYHESSAAAGGIISGARNVGYVAGTGAKGTISAVVGMYGGGGFLTTGVTGTISNFYGVISESPINADGTGRFITSSVGLYAQNMGGNGVTSAYGLYVEHQSAITNAFSLYAPSTTNKSAILGHLIVGGSTLNNAADTFRATASLAGISTDAYSIYADRTLASGLNDANVFGAVAGAPKTSGSSQVDGVVTGFHAFPRHESSGTCNAIFGMFSENYVSGTGLKGTIQNMVGYSSDGGFLTGAATGTIVSYKHYYAGPTQNATAGQIITESAAFYGSNQGTPNTVTAYGLYLENQVGASANSWAIYSLGGKSYHNGSLGIGISTFADAAKLNVFDSYAGSSADKVVGHFRQDITSGSETAFDSNALRSEAHITGSATYTLTLAGSESWAVHETTGTGHALIGFLPASYVDGSGTKGLIDICSGIQTYCGFGNTSVTGSIGELNQFEASVPQSTGATRTVASASGLVARAQSGPGITTAYGIRILSQPNVVVTAPATATSYGLHIAAQLTGQQVTNPWAIYSEGGKSSHLGLWRFGDNAAPIIGLEVSGANTVAGIMLTDGRNLPVSAANTCRFRYDQVTQKAQLSENGSPFADIGGGGAGVTAGAGLVLTGSTLDVVANGDGSIVVNANDLQVGVISDAQHGSRGNGSLHTVASGGANGFMSSADFTKLAGVEANAINALGGAGLTKSGSTLNVIAGDASITVNANDITVGVISDVQHGNRSGGALHAVATGGANGFMSAADKSKLDGIDAGAQNIVAGAGLTETGSTIDVIANGDGSIVVAANDVGVGVLATDAQHGVRGGGTQHAAATTSVAGFMSASDKTKLDAATATATATTLLLRDGSGGAELTTTKTNVVTPITAIDLDVKLGDAIGDKSMLVKNSSGAVVATITSRGDHRRERFQRKYDFEETLNTNLMVASNSGSASQSTVGAGNGLRILSTGATSASTADVATVQTVAQRALKSHCEIYVQPLNAGTLANKSIFCGFSTFDGSGGESEAFFYYDSASSPNWKCRTSDGATDTNTTTGVAVDSGGGFQKLRVELDSAAVRFYIGGTLVATHSTNLPASLDLMRLVALSVTNSAAASKASAVDYWEVWADRYA